MEIFRQIGMKRKQEKTRENKRKNWNNPLVWSWLVLWIMACISDFLLPKEFRYVGYVMVLACGFLFLFGIIWKSLQS